MGKKKKMNDRAKKEEEKEKKNLLIGTLFLFFCVYVCVRVTLKKNKESFLFARYLNFGKFLSQTCLFI